MLSTSGKCLKEFENVLNYGYCMIDMACKHAVKPVLLNSITHTYSILYNVLFADHSVTLPPRTLTLLINLFVGLGIKKHRSARCELFQEAEGKYCSDDKNLLSLSGLLHAYNGLM